ncbi:MAG: winged helix-turn-helix transcriptional regulator [Chloroflexi bacterium]|nr:winged helix-turn-helix transcriptional regulator [Chloroflexota bacterium]
MEISPLRQEVTNLHADVCSALADPSRILILYALAEKPYTVNDLAGALGLPQPTTSRHLKVLRDRNLVEAVRQGMNVEYRLLDHRLIEALDLLRGVMRDRISHHANVIQEVLVEGN